MTPKTPEPSAWVVEAADKIVQRLDLRGDCKPPIVAIIQSHAPQSGDVTKLRTVLSALLEECELNQYSQLFQIAGRIRAALASVPAPAHASDVNQRFISEVKKALEIANMAARNEQNRLYHVNGVQDRLRDALKFAAESAQPVESCAWLTHGTVFKTSCGESIQYGFENYGARFCLFCSKPIIMEEPK